VGVQARTCAGERPRASLKRVGSVGRTGLDCLPGESPRLFGPRSDLRWSYHCRHQSQEEVAAFTATQLTVTRYQKKSERVRRR